MTTKNTETKNTETKTTESKKDNIIIIRGVNVVRAFYGTTKYNPTKKNHVTIKGDIPYDSITAFEGSGPKLTPTWYKNRDGYMNLASVFDIPVLTDTNKQIDFDEWITEYNTIGAIVNVKAIQKDGAIYPVAIQVLEDGEEINPFEGM